jgi:hypothetical protein
MTDNYKFDGTHETKMYGDNIRVRSRIQNLHKVEKYFIEQCEKLNIEFSYDCQASERVNWSTLNYTNYCGMMFISPLCHETSLVQLYDAALDNMNDIGHINFIKNNIKNNIANKYLLNTDRDDKEFKKYDGKRADYVCVLPGHNKFHHVNGRKIKTIANHFRSNLIFKLHPITTDEILRDSGFHSIVERYNCQVAGQDIHLYDLIEKSKGIYSTYASETALTALICGKTVEPIDNYDNINNNGFSPISHFCYNYKDAVEKLSKIFASHKSGIIHPDIDKDWKDKVNNYLKYILEKRELQNGFFLQ